MGFHGFWQPRKCWWQNKRRLYTFSLGRAQDSFRPLVFRTLIFKLLALSLSSQGTALLPGPKVKLGITEISGGSTQDTNKSIQWQSRWRSLQQSMAPSSSSRGKTVPAMSMNSEVHLSVEGQDATVQYVSQVPLAADPQRAGVCCTPRGGAWVLHLRSGSLCFYL